MAPSSPASIVDPSPLEIPQWLKTLPLAPEYHPTHAEFEDPISYILKIEKEASTYGICKIVPPVPAPPRKTAILNLNRSFSARNESGGNGSKKAPATFTTRQQQIGFCPRRPRPVQKPVWQSGEQYTLQQFESKAKQFEKNQMRKYGKNCAGGGFSSLEVETLFWKASADKPIIVEYANDMPGSGFTPISNNAGSKKWRTEDTVNVGDTAWNMRGVSREKGSLLKFMKEEIPGVTSPMVYVAMMFSWFAWHVEDHELHSLNYLHMGAGKTWYGVPRDAGLAFEEVVRVHGYGGEVNPLVTFAVLGEKTTIMSPEVLFEGGIPCCRLVQNAGDFVVTFPGAYHSGFSHGFNCGEASNIATPEWLKYAKEAAVRRASINYPPMVSHFQLLYELAISLSSRTPTNGDSQPRSSRLKQKKKSEGDMMIKEHFVQNVMQNNSLLHTLLSNGSSCVILPENTFEVSTCHARSQMKIKPRLSLGLSSREEALEASSGLPLNSLAIDRHMLDKNLNDVSSINPVSTSQLKSRYFHKCNKSANEDLCTSMSDSHNMDCEKESAFQGVGLFDQGLLSCVTCGILSFACVAVIQPTDAAAIRLMSADWNTFDDHSIDFRASSDVLNDSDVRKSCYEFTAGSGVKNSQSKYDDYLVHPNNHETRVLDQMHNLFSDKVVQERVSALDLLASAYGDSSDSEEVLEPEMPLCNKGEHPCGKELCPLKTDSKIEADEISQSFSGSVSVNKSGGICGGSNANTEDRYQRIESFESNHSTVSLGSRNDGDAPGKLKESIGPLPENVVRTNLQDRQMLTDGDDLSEINEKKALKDFLGVGGPLSCDSHYFSDDKSPKRAAIAAQLGNLGASVKSSSSSFIPDKDSTRMHVFCLEHALEVAKQLQPIGGVHIVILCHPEYPKIEAEAKSVAEQLEMSLIWNDINFKEASKEDQERIKLALEDEEAYPSNTDWSVKMRVNLYYSANLSKSPLYSKQMPYNAVIYKAFGRDCSSGSPGKLKVFQRRRRQKRIVVSGKWCGRVWMSNQVHPYLAYRNVLEEQDCVSRSFPGNIDQQRLEKDNDNTSTIRIMDEKPIDVSDTPERTFTRRRKKPLEKPHAKKLKYTQTDANSDMEDSIENYSRQHERFIRNHHAKNTTTSDIKTEMEDSTEISSVQRERIVRNGRVKKPSASIQDDTEKTNKSGKLHTNDDGNDGGPSTRLRKRPSARSAGIKMKFSKAEKPIKKKKENDVLGKKSLAKEAADEEFSCDVEGCIMSFSTKQDLALHKRNICPIKGCGKKFFSHKYLVQHRRVHLDDRPLKCPWKGCKMTFKWAWARTEHVRVHTGDRPYICMERGCGQTFRFVSDFSRHKRKTGHISKKGR